MDRTITDAVAYIYDNQIPVEIGGTTRVLRTRDDIHEWLAQYGIDSNDRHQMSMLAEDPAEPQPIAGLPQEARPEVTSIGGPSPAPPPLLGGRGWESPTLLAAPVPGQTMYDLPADVSQAAGRLAEGIGGGITEAIGGFGGELRQTIEGMGPELEEAVRRAPHQVSPSQAHRPMYRARAEEFGIAPPGSTRNPYAPDEGQGQQELTYLERFISEQPEVLPDGRENLARKIAVEEWEKVRPGKLEVAAEGLGQLALNALAGGGAGAPPTLPMDTLSASANVGDLIYEPARFLASEAGNVVGLGAGLIGRAVDAGVELAKRAPRAIQDAGQALSIGDHPPTPMKGLPYMGLEGQIPPEDELPDVPGIQGSGWQGLTGPARSRNERELALQELAQRPEFASMPPEKKVQHVISGLTSAYNHMEEITQKRMPRDTLDNMRSDLSDLMSVVPLLATMVFGIPEEELEEGNIVKRFTTAIERSVHNGVTLADSALAGLGFIIANPLDSLHTMPVSTILTFADVALAMRAARHPAMSNPKVIAALEKMEAVKDKYMPAIRAAGGKVGAILDPTGEIGAGIGVTAEALGDFRTAWKQAWGDATYNANPLAWLHGDEVVRRANQEGAAARAAMEDMGALLEDVDEAGRPTSGAHEGTGGHTMEFEEFDKVVSEDGTIVQPQEGAPVSGVAQGTARTAPFGGGRRREAEVKSKTLWGEVKRVRDELVRTLDDMAGTAKQDHRRKSYKAADVDKAISEALSFVIPNQILMSKTARTQVLKDITAWASNKSIHGERALSGDALKAFVEQAKKEVLGMASRDKVKDVTGSPSVYNLRLKMGDWDGGTFSVLDDSLLRLADDAALDGMRRSIYRESMAALGGRVAQIAEQHRRQLATIRALESHAPRAAKATRNEKTGQWEFKEPPSNEVAQHRIEASLADQGQLPAALRVDGEILAQYLEVAWADKTHIHGVSKKKLLRQLRGYKRLSDSTTMMEMGLMERPKGPTRRVARMHARVGKAIYVNKATHRTMSYWARDVAARASVDPWTRVVRQVKANLTARNPSTHVNNIISNAVIQSIRRGDILHPLKVMKIGREYKQFLKGKLDDPAKRDMYRAIRRTGGLRSDLVISELRALQRGDDLNTGGLSWKPEDWPGVQTMERTYAWEDNVFKLEEAVHNYKRLTDELGRLGEGRWAEVQVGRNKVARLTRVGDKWRAEISMAGAKRGEKSRAPTPANPRGEKSRVLTDSQLRDLVAQASMKPALDLFFDYNDVGLIGAAVRSAGHGGLGLFLSPFYTWYSKALSMPFAGQPGLAGHMMSSRPFIRTDDAKLLSAQVADAVAASARRSMVANSARQEVIDNKDMLAKLLGGFGYKNVPALMFPVVSASNPLYFEFKNLEYMSPSQPADTLLRMIHSGAGTLHLPTLADAIMRSDVDVDVADAFYTPSGVMAAVSTEAFRANDDDLDALQDPVKKRRMKVMRNIFRRNLATAPGTQTWTDATEMLGVAGGLATEFLFYMSKVDKADYEQQKMYDTFAAALLPGLYARAFDVGAGAAYEFANAPSIDWLTTDPDASDEMKAAYLGHAPFDKREKQFMRWATRRLFGLALQPQMVLGHYEQVGEGGEVRFEMTPGKFDRMMDKVGNRLRESMVSPAVKAVEDAHKSWIKNPNRQRDRDADPGYRKLMDAVVNLDTIGGTKKARKVWRGLARKRATGPWPMHADHNWAGVVNEELKLIKKRYTDVLGPMQDAMRSKGQLLQRWGEEDAQKK